METEILKDPDIEAWLSECRTKTTREAYAWRISLFFRWLDKEKALSLAQWKALDIKQMKTLALQFQNNEPVGEGRIFKSKHVHRDTGTTEHVRQAQPLSKNAINGILTSVQSFGMYLEKPLLLKGKRFGAEDDNHSHYFVNGDLEKMYDVSDYKGKAILTCASSLGWEVSDFLALDRKLVEDHIKKADAEGRHFIYFKTTRTKTHVPRLAVLNPLAIESLKKWLPVNPTNRMFDMTKSGITKFMQSTAKKAALNTTGPVRFHRIRAWTFNSLLKAGFSDAEAKYIVGKAIPHSDGTYLRLQEGIEQKYPKLYNEYLNIKPERVQVPEDLKRENEDLKQRIHLTEEKLASIERMILDLKKQVPEA